MSATCDTKTLTVYAHTHCQYVHQQASIPDFLWLIFQYFFSQDNYQFSHSGYSIPDKLCMQLKGPTFYKASVVSSHPILLFFNLWVPSWVSNTWYPALTSSFSSTGKPSHFTSCKLPPWARGSLCSFHVPHVMESSLAAYTTLGINCYSWVLWRSWDGIWATGVYQRTLVKGRGRSGFSQGGSSRVSFAWHNVVH